MALILCAAACLCLAAVPQGTKSKPVPLACDALALSAAKRARHSELVRTLSKRRGEIKELPSGYELRYTSARAVWSLVSEWAGLESRCCPFLDLSVTVSASKDLVVVRIVGPRGVKSFLREELGALVSKRP